MKKQISLIVAGLLYCTAAIYANQMPISGSKLLVSIEKSDTPASLDLRLANLEKQGTLILLQDVSGNTWFSQHVWRKNGYAQKLNLKGMPDGTYTLSVKHKDATIIQAMHLSNGVLEVLKHQRMEVPAPPKQDLVEVK